jgi:hypothetical protein
MTGPEGELWAVGESMWQLDGEEWTEMSEAREGLLLPDGSTVRMRGNGGVEHVNGDTTTRYLKGRYINGIALAPDGSVWAVGGLDREENGGVYRIRPKTGS